MAVSGFAHWLAGLLNESDYVIGKLLRDRTALDFLIAWSLLESKCFDGFATSEKLQPFADRIALEAFDMARIEEAVRHFHSRYQDVPKLNNLVHEKKSGRSTRSGSFRMLLKKPFADLSRSETVYLAVFTVYRFRNNIFHGNKSVAGWKKYEEQIDYCTRTMQAFVSHAEASVTTMARRSA